MAPLLILLGAASGCGDSGSVAGDAAQARPTEGEDLPRVPTVAVEARDLTRQIEMPGTVEGDEQADLYAKVGGFLEEIHVDIGDRVSQGQKLARLAIPEMHKELSEKQALVATRQAELRRDEAELRELQSRLREKQALLNQQTAELERVQDLVERGSLQQRLLDEATYQHYAAQAALETVIARIETAEAQVRSSQARIDLAQAEYEKVATLLEYGTIRAPYPGLIVKRFFDAGAFIQPAEGNSAARPLLSLARVDVVRVKVDLPMAQVRWLDRGDRVLFDRIGVLPGRRFEGEVARFASALDRSSRTMRVEIDLQNPEQELLPGYYGYVTVLLDELPATPVIPSSALGTTDSETFVYVVDGGVCRKRSVSVIYEDGAIVGVGTGLQPGEQVVQSGTGQLHDGQRVVAVDASSE